jgi:hypothetical protein
MYKTAGLEEETANDCFFFHMLFCLSITYSSNRDYRLSLLEVESVPDPVPVVSVGVTGVPELLVIVSVVVVLGVVVSVPVEEPGVSQAQSDPATKAIKRMLFIVFNFVLIYNTLPYSTTLPRCQYLKTFWH